MKPVFPAIPPAIPWAIVLRAMLALLLAPVPGAIADGNRILNDFELEPSNIPVDEILRGGPPRDAIPALDSPATVTADEATYGPDERVIGVTLGNEARAYPLSLLVWHELANDTLGGEPILVSYCPLCGTALVFDRRLDGRVLRFGVSGLLYHSDLLMFDRDSESLWSQISATAVTGARLGKRLRLLRSQIVRWDDWKREHPATTVLSQQTGHQRAYGTSPYEGYEQSKRIYFPVALDARYHPKMPTLGLRLADGRSRGYPGDEVERAGGRVRERFADRDVEIRFAKDTRTFQVSAPADVEVIEGFWFAWAAFHPTSTVFRAARDETVP